MISIESQDWDELLKLLKDTEESLAALSVGDGEKEIERSRQSLVAFHTTASMFGFEGLEKAGVELEKFLTGNVSAGSVDSIAALEFAISSVIDQMNSFSNGNGSSPEIDLIEILEILNPPDMAASALEGNELSPEPVEPIAQTGLESNDGDPALELDFTNFTELVKEWGGELSVFPEADSGAEFCLTFKGSAGSLKKLEKLFFADESMGSVSKTPAEEAAINNLVANGAEFMKAFSSGDLDTAQKILLKLSDQQPDSSGLYKQIGGMARGLHDSIRGFLNTLDPSLNEIVKDKIPDSGNRLEHIMKMTEKAAITTLDHVETVQERLSKEVEQISVLRGLIGGLTAIGDSAGGKLEQAAQSLNDIETIIGQNRSDLDIIMTAQDYQDLSGQILLKVTQLLKDIEDKLVNVIRTFGVKAETAKQNEKTELYGPAHSACENAVHSQDEVDSMLAEFGF
ncbi:putative Enhancer of CheY-P dephosphorylation [Syntrophobacter sp. SbD1]|nr:putative Enhancer of CheY-P dephosphorylation [Syntrophobacter sp. SbD1]